MKKMVLLAALAVAPVLKIGFERNAQLRRALVDPRQPHARRQLAHPAGADRLARDLAHHADVACALAPLLGIDAHAGLLQHLDRPQRRRRRIPQRHVQPMPQSRLVGPAQRTQAQAAGALSGAQATPPSTAQSPAGSRPWP